MFENAQAFALGAYSRMTSAVNPIASTVGKSAKFGAGQYRRAGRSALNAGAATMLGGGSKMEMLKSGGAAAGRSIAKSWNRSTTAGKTGMAAIGAAGVGAGIGAGAVAADFANPWGLGWGD